MRVIKASGFAVILLVLLCRYASADILMIVNSSVKETTITKADIKRIFLGKKKWWDDKQKVNAVIIKESPVHSEFVTTYIDKSPSSFSSYWKRAVVTGTGIPPKSFDTEAEIVKFIQETAGSVGYISVDTPHDGVNILTIE